MVINMTGVKAKTKMIFLFWGVGVLLIYSRLFYSFLAESDVRWGENRRSLRKTT